MALKLFTSDEKSFTTSAKSRHACGKKEEAKRTAEAAKTKKHEASANASLKKISSPHDVGSLNKQQPVVLQGVLERKHRYILRTIDT